MILHALREIEKTAATQENGNDKNKVVAALFGETPASTRLKLSQYPKSPMTKTKLSSNKLLFSDFEAEIKQAEFDHIPSYQRARTTLVELQEFLDNVVIKCFNSKYEIYFKSRACLKTSDFQLQTTFKQQANYFEGSLFVTVGDLARIQNKNVDKKQERFLQNLRFLKLIKEVRKNSVVCYLWLKNKD